MFEPPIYLDCHATTPLDDRVLATMLPYFSDRFGNPASAGHHYGWEAAAAVKLAREEIAAAIGATPEEILFTSGATEANNLAIKGIAEAHMSRGQHLITVATEHEAVLAPCRYLEKLGFRVTVLPVTESGLVDVATLSEAIAPDTTLVSVMAANNEIGVLQPLTEIGALCRKRGVPFHTDAAQAIGKIPLDVAAQTIDLLSLTAHKLYGPKGIGALYVRRPVQIAPQLHGGGQERQLRPGTLAPAQIIGLAKAITLGRTEMHSERERLSALRDRLWHTLARDLDGVILNGDLEQRLPGNLNVSFEGVDGNALLLGLQKKLAISAGSACTSATGKPSHVLTALGRSKNLALASVRFGLGRLTTDDEIDRAAAHTITTVRELRERSRQ
ncbi:MAG: aminotransferase class V-fold PLP-dependent enzyme [Cyanobacteria bacterium J06641_5]